MQGREDDVTLRSNNEVLYVKETDFGDESDDDGANFIDDEHLDEKEGMHKVGVYKSDNLTSMEKIKLKCVNKPKP